MREKRKKKIEKKKKKIVEAMLHDMRAISGPGFGNPGSSSPGPRAGGYSSSYPFSLPETVSPEQNAGPAAGVASIAAPIPASSPE